MDFVEPSHTSSGNNSSPGTSFDPTQRGQRRRLIMQDSLALLTLAGTTLVLAVITYFFFSSFRRHRIVLESRWFGRGVQALGTGRAQDAVEDFRSALSLSPGNRIYETNLAQALAAAGHTDEAFSYYSTLRDAAPSDGMLNLQLARLAVKKNEPSLAISYYQNALNGDWITEGIAHRRGARLEMARYLLLQHQPMPAQMQLITAEGNALGDPTVMIQIATLLEQANFQTDALTAYKRARQHAAADSPEMMQALLGESRLEESLGQYTAALETQEHYMARVHHVHHPPEAAATAEAELDKLQRLVALDALPSLPPQQRAHRLLMDGSIAQKRFMQCLAPLETGAQESTGLTSLTGQWQSFGKLTLAQLADDPSSQDALSALVGQTEMLANQLCGPPSEDDALLLQLTMVPNKTE